MIIDPTVILALISELSNRVATLEQENLTLRKLLSTTESAIELVEEINDFKIYKNPIDDSFVVADKAGWCPGNYKSIDDARLFIKS